MLLEKFSDMQMPDKENAIVRHAGKNGIVYLRYGGAHRG